jgi:hypothetical protein
MLSTFNPKRWIVRHLTPFAVERGGAVFVGGILFFRKRPFDPTVFED